jgi:energy-coupling factor transporter transmembrane protein EcfT
MSRLQPHIRLVSAVVLIAAAVLVPLDSSEGWLFLSVVLLFSVMVGFTSPGLARGRGLVAGWIGITVVFGIAPWVIGFFIDPALRSPDGILSLGGIALRSASTSGVALFIISSMGIAEVHRGLVHLPLPRSLKILTLHILHQAGLVIAETRRVHQAIAVRSASSGVQASWLLLRSLPQVWLSRVMHRSERVAYALELRGIGAESVRLSRSNLRLADWLALSLSTGLLILSTVLIR